jgi:hypothetical protein
MAAETTPTPETWHRRIAASALSAAKLQLLQAFDNRRRIVESTAVEKQRSSQLETPVKDGKKAPVVSPKLSWRMCPKPEPHQQVATMIQYSAGAGKTGTLSNMECTRVTIEIKRAKAFPIHINGDSE